tara:strand:- start:88 stop:348 length:261 start_codon:yes stop_codon:yes gene_type:complete
MYSPALHVVCGVHASSLWLVAFWYVSAPHAVHVLAAVLLSAEMNWPAPHVGCDTQAVFRWLVAFWYVSAGHPLQVRAAVASSADIS